MLKKAIISYYLKNRFTFCVFLINILLNYLFVQKKYHFLKIVMSEISILWKNLLKLLATIYKY